MAGVFAHGVNLYQTLVVGPLHLGFLHNCSRGSAPGSWLRRCLPYNIDGAISEQKTDQKRGASEALMMNSLLVVIFCAQHSGMARAGFKQLVPESLRHLERTFYCLFSGGALHLLLHCWRPLPRTSYDMLPSASPTFKSFLQLLVQLLGLAMQLSTIQIFDQPKGSFFGMYQASTGVTSFDNAFKTEGLLNFIRHPIM
jgi:protein-S-isoprenylcysteine O-methyltransferase Ste14